MKQTALSIPEESPATKVFAAVCWLCAPHSVYRGEWRAGMMHGCGVKLWRTAAAAGESAAGASPQSGQPISVEAPQTTHMDGPQAALSPTAAPAPAPAAPGAQFVVQEGKFFADEFVGPILSCT